jgi:hypothetical protein
MTKDTPTVTVDLIKCKKILEQNNNPNFIFFKSGLTPPENPREQFFNTDFPRSLINLSLGEENIIITYDKEQEKPIAKDSSGNEVEYDYKAVTNDNKLENDYTNFTNCLKAATKQNISTEQIEYIVNTFNQRNIMSVGAGLLDITNNGIMPADNFHHDTLHIKFGKDDNMELTLNSAISVVTSIPEKRPQQTIIGYSEYKDKVKKDGVLESSNVSIQGDNDYFLFNKLAEIAKDCITENKDSNIKTKIVEHIINTGKEIKDKSLELNFGGKPIPDYQGKTIVEEILIKKMVHYLDQSFKKLNESDRQKLTDEKKQSIKEGLQEITKPFAKIPAFKELGWKPFVRR